MKAGTIVNYYCPGQVIKQGILQETISERMELAQDYDGSEYCWVRPIGSEAEGTETRWQYITLTFDK